jgi:hypothetical protein
MSQRDELEFQDRQAIVPVLLERVLVTVEHDSETVTIECLRGAKISRPLPSLGQLGAARAGGILIAVATDGDAP